MNVPNIGPGLGSTSVLTRPQTGGVVALPLRGSPVSDAPAPEAALAADASATFVRIGWFDANGDGHIDERSVNAGGDATILLPHTVKPPTLSRSVTRQLGVGRPVSTTKPAEDTAPVPTPPTAAADKAAAPAPPEPPVPAPVSDAQTRQAIESYQRYGQPSDTGSTDRAVA
jgi:hypothetical protein